MGHFSFHRKASLGESDRAVKILRGPGGVEKAVKLGAVVMNGLPGRHLKAYERIDLAARPEIKLELVLHIYRPFVACGRLCNDVQMDAIKGKNKFLRYVKDNPLQARC